MAKATRGIVTSIIPDDVKEFLKSVSDSSTQAESLSIIEFSVWDNGNAEILIEKGGKFFKITLEELSHRPVSILDI